MKKRLAILLGVVSLMMIAVLTGCGSSGTGAEIDYGNSELYTQEDMDQAIEMIEKEFGTWEGCELYNIRYASDDANSAENIKWMNELAGEKDIDQEFTQCIEFLSDFHSPAEPGEDTAWEADTDYTDWQWWLARTDGGEWQLMTFGY